MNILLLASFRKNKSGNIFGGAEKSITNLSNWLSGKGHNVVLASVEGAEMPYSISIGVKTEFCRIYSQNKIRIHMEVAKSIDRILLYLSGYILYFMVCFLWKSGVFHFFIPKGMILKNYTHL